MAAKLLGSSKKGLYYHFNFTLRYNTIARKKTPMEKCDHKAENLIYASHTHCIYIEQTKGIHKRASERKIECIASFAPFHSFFSNITIEDLPDYSNKLFKKNDLLRVLTPTVFSTKDIEEVMEDLMSNLIVDSSSVTPEGIKLAFTEGMRVLRERELKVKSENSFGHWLYDYVFKTLDNSFIVETQEENLREVGKGFIADHINEYAMSKADLVIRKAELLPLDDNPPKCCVIFVNDIPALEVVSGMVAELKIDDETSYVWECFRNMSGVAASLAVELLTQGTIVNKVVVFGVVALVNHHKRSQLIKLECNFDTEKCEFTRCRGLFDIDILMNIVICAL